MLFYDMLSVHGVGNHSNISIKNVYVQRFAILLYYQQVQITCYRVLVC